MKKEKTESILVGDTSIQKPTNRLRWKKKKGSCELILQQAWIDTQSGQVEWRDTPIEDENQE